MISLEFGFRRVVLQAVVVLFALVLGVGGVGPPIAIAAAPATEPAVATSPRPSLRAAILPVRVEGELSEVDRDALVAELVGGLERGSFAVVAPADVLARDPDASDCAAAKCYRKVAQSTQASHLVRARVLVRDRDYDVRVELVDGATGSIVAKSEEGCEICGIVDAGALMASAAATLRTKLDALAKGPSTLTVSSDPEGAEVTVDGEFIGVTPLDRPVIGGKKIVRVSKDGYIVVEREVTVVDGVAEQLAFTLEKVPSRLPKRPWGWVSLGLGVAALGTAVTFAVLDDRPYEIGSACKGDNLDASGNCRELWSTEWIIFGTSIAAATLVTLGVAVLLTTGGKRGRKAKAERSGKASASVGVGPGSLTVRGRF